MPRVEKEHFCFNCGESCGSYFAVPGDIHTCGAAECEREARYADQADRTERREAAERDDYGRY